jgi:F-type H+-transporting ATPase subunit b
MPQLDISAFSPQIIWLFITFILLYVLMAKVALPRIGGILEQRQARIDDNLDAAQNLRNESQADAEAYDKSLAEAREQARMTIYEATQEISNEAARRHEDLGAKLSGEIKAAEERITEAKDAAIADIQLAASGVAAKATERLIGVVPDEEAVNSAIISALNASGKENS